MVFSSVVFLFTFLPITLVVYFVSPEKMRNSILLLASLVFYAWGEPIYFFLMLLSILINYVCGLDIERNKENPIALKRSLLFAIIVNVLILGFFKYYGFLIQTMNQLLHLRLPYRELALPVGISFYTFQILSYIIDVYRGKVKVQKNIIKFGVYVTMFPQLVAGPIVQYKEIEEQLRNRTHSIAKFGDGAATFIRGLSKKVLLANVIGAVFRDIIHMDMNMLSAGTAWIGCLAYTFQIYFDFSGYSDMAVGLGRMFGFEFAQNFRYPYMSKSITDFWRRWHISLGSWFREYVYIPLGGNRTSVKKHIRNIMIVWILTGLWHGASWNFVVWGLYYGIILLVEKYVLQGFITKLPHFLQWAYSFLLIMIGWVFFFSESFIKAMQYLGIMFGLGDVVIFDRIAVSFFMPNVMLLMILAICSTVVPRKIMQVMKQKKTNAFIAIKCIAYTLLLVLSTAYMITETYNPFLYFRF